MYSFYPVSPEGGVSITPVDVVYDEEDNVTFTCHSLGGPGNTFQWLINGQVLEDEREPTLLLSSITVASDGGVYTCVVMNSAGAGNASVQLNIGPVIDVHPVDIHAVRGANVSFTCNARAFPSPQYEWMRVDSPLPETALAQHNVLVISAVSFGDEGDYYCTATSSGITVSSNTATLTSEFQYYTSELVFKCLRLNYQH